MGVSKNNGTPKSSILMGFVHYKPSILGYPYFWKHPYVNMQLSVFLQVPSFIPTLCELGVFRVVAKPSRNLPILRTVKVFPVEASGGRLPSLKLTDIAHENPHHSWFSYHPKWWIFQPANCYIENTGVYHPVKNEGFLQHLDVPGS